jgi:hypothetical protein
MIGSMMKTVYVNNCDEMSDVLANFHKISLLYTEICKEDIGEFFDGWIVNILRLGQGLPEYKALLAA